MKFKSWKDVYQSILNEDATDLYYVVKHPTETDRTRFMNKSEVLAYCKVRIATNV